MFPELCPVCHYMSYKEESGEYYSDGMQISPNEGYCSHCDFRYSEHIKHPIEEQVKKHMRWLKKISDIYKNIILEEKKSLIKELELTFKRIYGFNEKDKYKDFLKQINKMSIKKLNNVIANMKH